MLHHYSKEIWSAAFPAFLLSSLNLDQQNQEPAFPERGLFLSDLKFERLSF
jgi:hypothetical protein